MKAKIKNSPFEVDVMPYFDGGWFVGYCTTDEARCCFTPESLDFSVAVLSDAEHIPFSDCGPSTKLSNLISRTFGKDIQNVTLAEIASKSRRYFMTQRNFGQVTLAELERILDRYSLKLKL